VHAVVPVHDTLIKSLSEAAGALGDFTMLQAVPFHFSTRVEVMPLLLAVEVPTAVHVVAPVHDTSFNWLAEAPTGLGERTMLQVVEAPVVPALASRAVTNAATARITTNALLYGRVIDET
jgi:hypothetical protein